jgi:hypothetical protein
MIERAERAGFLLKAGAETGVYRECGGQHLDRDHAV